MSKFVTILAAFAFFVFTSPAYGQATRTWVSGVGDDVNPCSRTAPCKTFAGAISKTLAGGEINCLDPGGFGAVTVTKSITLDCTGTLGSILNSGTNGIIINDSATAMPNTIEVLIRGITIDGAGTTPGLNGIRFLSGRSLVLQNVFIQNENGAAAISIQPIGTAEFYAEDVTATDSNVGILIQPTGVAGSVRAFLRNVRSQNNSDTGLNISAVGNSSTAGSVVVIEKSEFTGNVNGLMTNAQGATPNTVMISDSVIAGNTTLGVRSAGSASRIRVSNSTITANGTGVAVPNGGTLNSFGNNRLEGNQADGSFTAPVVPQE